MITANVAGQLRTDPSREDQPRMDQHLLNNHFRFVTDDLDHSREVMGKVWQKHDIQLNRGWKYTNRWQQADLKRLSFIYSYSPTSLRIHTGPDSRSYKFASHLSGCNRYRLNGREAVLSPVVAGLHAPSQELVMETMPHRLLVLALDHRFVDQALARRFGPLPPFEDWAREFPTESGPAATLRSLCHWAADELDRPGTALLTSARASAGLEKLLLGLFLDCLEERQPPGKCAREDAGARQVRRVLDWLDAHFAEPLTVDDLAAVGGVSARALQAAFRRIHGCTPMEALAARRLQAARDALQAATPATTVTQVATDCGFFHFGRFARDYRQAFGELPSATLARARRRR